MNDANDPNLHDDDEPKGESEDSPKVVSTRELFGDEREICIEHAGELYRLRITRRNKLILQK